MLKIVDWLDSKLDIALWLLFKKIELVTEYRTKEFFF